MSIGDPNEIIPTMEQLPTLWTQDGEPFCDMVSEQEQQERRLTTLTLSSTSNISADGYDAAGESKCQLPLMAKSTELTVVVE